MFQNLLQIDQYIHQQGYQATSSMHLVQQIGTSILPMLYTLLENEGQLQRVASMSYHHRNGFDRIVLIKSEQKLRLHIWWPQEDSLNPQPRESIHNHAWDFSSTILTGSFQFQTFSQAGPLEVDHYTVGNDSSLQFVGKMSLTCFYDAILPVGCSYSFEHTVPHRVINMPYQTTSTLILQSPSRKSYSDVYIDHPMMPKDMSVPPKFTPDELAMKLQRYIRLLM